MLKNYKYYKGHDILNDNFKERMDSYFNPYEYNIESTKKDNVYNDINNMKTKSHKERGNIKK